MKKEGKIFARILALFMTVLLVTGTFAAVGLTARAATTTNERENTTYDIAVAFDNSGSMYDDERWCHAKYAMEIFASMLDFNKDRLSIFPMWEVTTDKDKTLSKASYERIDISSKEDIDKIHYLFTPDAYNTPFAPIDEAYDYLLNESTADEKWLIVMTDGEFNMGSRTEGTNTSKSKQEVQDYISGKAIKDVIKVQYFGFGNAYELDSDESIDFYANEDSDASIQDELINICNRIFERSVLDDDYFDDDDGELELEISMNKLIVFAQGPNATINSLTDSSGKEIKKLYDSEKRQYSTLEYSTNGRSPDEDQSLAGQVVTFDACPAGEYILNCTGAKKIQIFYEPDVDLKVELLNSDGYPVTPDNGKVVEGDYSVRTSIVDSVTGEDVTDSELLNIEYLNTYYKTSADADYTTYSEHGGKKGEKITFNADETAEIKIDGRYLENYRISSDGDDFDWLRNIIVLPKVIDFKLNAEVLQKSGEYYHFPDSEWKPIKVTFTYEGKPLTAEQMAKTDIKFTFDPELKYRYEVKENESACYVYIDENKSGGQTERDGVKWITKFEPTGDYKFTVTATFTNEDNKQTTVSDTAEFELTPIDPRYIDLLWLIITLIILTLITLWLIHPVLPKRVIISEGNFTKNATIKGSFKMPSRYDMRNVPVSGKAKVVRKSRNFWIMSKLKPKRMNFRITDVHTSGVGEFTCDGVTYTCEGGCLYDSAGEKVESMIISNSAVSWDENNGGYFEGTLHINRR